MYPLTHFLFPLALSLVLLKLNFFPNIYFVFLAALTGFLVDIDHYIHRIIVYKDFNIKNCWNKAVLNKDKKERTLIHYKKGIIIITLILILIFFISKLTTFALAIGYYSHILLDNLHIKLKKKFNLREFGFVIKLPLYEFILDLILILLIYGAARI